MIAEQYGVLLSTAISTGLILTFYPSLVQELIFIAIILWVCFFKLTKWAERKNISGYLNSLFASFCAIFGIFYLTKGSLIWFIVGFGYLIISIYTMKITIEETVTYG